MTIRKHWPLALACLLGTTVSAQSPSARDHFLIHPERPLAYLHLNHIGLGTPEEDGKAHERIWMEFQNNCILPIKLVVNGAPMGDSPSSVSVMDRLVPVQRFHVLTPEEDADLAPREMPRDASADVGSGYTVEPGEHLLFSLPASHFSRRWTIQIHFTFDLPTGKVMRNDKEWGGLTTMYLSYSLYDLPEQTQAELHKLGY